MTLAIHLLNQNQNKEVVFVKKISNNPLQQRQNDHAFRNDNLVFQHSHLQSGKLVVIRPQLGVFATAKQYLRCN